MQVRADRDLGVGHDDAVESPAAECLAVRELGIESDARPVRGIRPLALQVFCRGDHRDAIDDAARQEFRREAERERGLACAGGRRRKEVPRLRLEIPVESLGLPRPKLVCRAARGTLRIRGREVFCGEAQSA